VSVTVDSPEKQRVGVIGYCHDAADQGWSSAEVAAAVVFELTRSGCDLSTATPAHSHLRLQHRGGRCARTHSAMVIVIDVDSLQIATRWPSSIRILARSSSHGAFASPW
jgi:hypothetical protein